jgi:hypothetical protein
MFWMIAANYYGAEIPFAAPMGTMRALLLLTNIACLIVLRLEMFARQAGPCSHVRSHATTNAAIIICCFADMGVRDDVAGRPGWYGSLRGTGHSTNLNVKTDVRRYSSPRGMSFAYDALW